jgi:hypothetical protein
MADDQMAALGTTGHNTISRAELGAYYRRLGFSRGGGAAAAVFDDIAAHREPAGETGAPAATPPLAADPDLETDLANARNAMGQVIRKLQSVLADQSTSPDVRELAQAMMPDVAPWTGMPVRSGSEGEEPDRASGRVPGTDVHVDWHMTPEEWRQLQAVLAGELAPADSAYVQRLRADRIVTEEARRGR